MGIGQMWGTDPTIAITWPMIDGNNATSQVGSASVADIVTVNNATLSSSYASIAWADSRQMKYSTDGENVDIQFYAGGVAITNNPTTDNSTINSDCYAEFTFDIKTGYTFTPTGFSFNIGKAGTDNGAAQGVLTLADATTSSIDVYSPARTDKKYNSNPQSKTITGAGAFSAGSKVTFRIYIGGKLGGKSLYLADVQVTGTYAEAGGGEDPGENPEPADETAPTLSSSVPADDATDVAVEGTIVLTFSEAIASVDGSKFLLSGAAKGTVAIDGTDSKKVNVPYSSAENSATVTLSVAAGAVEDAAGNKSAALSDINFTTVAAAAPVVCPESGTIFSAEVAATSAQSIAASSSDLDLTSSQATVTGGSMSVYNGQSSAKNLIATQNNVFWFTETNGNTFFRVKSDCALQAGDVISADIYAGSSDTRGLWFSTATTYPSEPTAKATRTGAGQISYVVAVGDEIIGQTEFSIFRATGNSTYFNNVVITRPEKYSVTYWKNDGTTDKTVGDAAATIAANSFSREGYRFVEWNTQADGQGTTVAVGSAVTADKEVYAIWVAAYSVSYANTGAASGAAPTNANKYIQGETFKVAGAGSMVAPDNYAFGGWSDGTNTYQQDDDYTVGTSNVSFVPVWNLSYTVTYKANGGTKADGTAASDIVASNPAKITGCQFLPADGKVFVKWTDDAEGKGTEYLPGATVSTTLTLYAQYTTVACDARQSISKAVMTSATEASVTGYNDNEFAGTAKLASLGGSSGTSTYDFGDGEVTGYKLANSGKSFMLATLAKGTFQAGDQVKIAITTISANSRLDICAGSDKDNMLEVIRLENITAPGIYAYTLTSADATAINTAGYKSIGIFRASGENTNAFVYSIEITGCRNWSIYHTLTFKNVDGTATIAADNLAEGDLASTIAPSAPVVDDKYFSGWSESIGGTPVDLSAYTITEDKVLYAVYEDCPTYGTIFKFTVATGLDNGNIFAQVPNLMELTTENYLAELENGTVTAAVISSNNDRIRYNDQRGLEFNGDNKGTITISMDCPMKTGDVVRVINYAASGNKLNLSANSKDVLVDGNGQETIQTVEVPAEWNNLRTLVLSRGAKNPKFTYIEIYRRPVLTSVTLEDMNLKAGKTGTPVMTLNPEDALVTSQAWEITTSTATGTTIDASTGLITAGETTGEITVKVTLNGDKEATCTVKVVAGFEAPRPVTETTIWDWEPVATATDGPSITAPDTVLANYLAGDEWEMLAGNSGGRPYRSTTYKAYQGTSLYFNAEVPGMLRIYAGSTGNDKKVYVNGIEVGTTGPKAYLNNIAVPAGDVYITSESMRIYWMKFDTDLSAYELTDNVLGGYTRDITAGRYGTICLPKAGVMVGAAIFEVAYLDNNDPYKKIFFDEVISGEMVAGRPYIFLPNEGATQLGVFYTDDTEETAGNYRGLFGSYTQEVLATDGTNYILLNNQYCRVANPNTSVGANRAYFKIGVEGGVPTNAVAPAPGRRRVSMSAQGEQVATGMEETQSDNLQCAKIVIDGQFFILRGEKMYDATGRLVK